MNMKEFSEKNMLRCKTAFGGKGHTDFGLVLCAQEELGELAAAMLGVSGEKRRKAHLTNDDVLDAIADCITYLDLLCTQRGGCLDELLPRVFNFVSDRAKSDIKIGND